MKSESASTLPVETIDDADYEFLRKLVYERSRINLGPDKRALVVSRITKRLRALGLSGIGEYCRSLRASADEEELERLIDVISTNHTNFFREERHFEWMQKTLLPQWRAKSRGNFHVWSAAASSGEEPYSLAITLAEAFSALDGWTIDASDICTRVIEKARQGIYASERIAPVRTDLLRKYFQRGIGNWDGHFRVKEMLRDQVRFHRLNLFDSHYPFAHAFQLIFCRNVMIYFDRPTQESLVARLSEQLESGGHLVVGHSESLNGIRHSLLQLSPTIYRKP